MGCLFILNDSESQIFWKKNIFTLEKFIISESLISIIFLFIAQLTFPFDSINLIKQKILIESIIYYIFLLSLISLVISVLIKYIHINNKIKPNYRLCLMNFFGYIGLYIFFFCFILSLYVTLIILDWGEITGVIVQRRRISSKKKIIISLGTVIYTLVWNNLIIFITFFGLVDFLMETNIISKASKYLSEGNNINNQQLLFELFRIPIEKRNYNNIDKTNFLNDLGADSLNKKLNYSKLRIIMPNNNSEKYFGNENNKFREVEIIKRIEYNSIGVQTDDNNINIYNNYINENNNNLIDEDLSNNFILIKNKSLIDSKASINNILNAPIK